MSESRTTAELIDVIQEGVRFSGGTAMDGEEWIETLTALLTETAHPGFETVRVGQDGIPAAYPGVAGLGEALGDWISPYERFRVEIEEVIQAGDRLLFMARQVGTTRHGGVEIETPSGSVWELEDGQIKRMTYYLDRGAARKAAGLD